MPFTLSFSMLLASILIVLSAQVANSTPLPRDVGIITLPLQRVESTSNVHPQLALQQHMNRGMRRLAVMTGEKPPSYVELEGHLRRRLEFLDNVEGLSKRAQVPSSEYETLERRFFRHGVPKRPNAASTGLSLKAGKSRNPAVSADPVAIADTPDTTNSLGLDIEAQDVGYLATVQIGTPPRDFLILMDSGSADFWVGSENCTSQSGGGCGNHKFLGQQSSSTFQETDRNFEVTYGTGNVQGNIITDNVSIAGLALSQHTFGVATQESEDFSSNTVPFDGLMGLAQSLLSEQDTSTPVESLADAGLIKDAIVSFKISRLADNKNDGEITFGGLDSSKFDSSTLVTLPNVNKDGFWEAALDGASVDGVDAGLNGRTAILDTGTTLIIAPSADATALHQQIPGAQPDGQGGFTIPCTTNVTLAFTFGKQAFDIDTRDLAFQPVDPNDPTGDCVSGIASGDVGGKNEWLVGDVFLKNAYFSTDVTKNTLSLAKLV